MLSILFHSIIYVALSHMLSESRRLRDVAYSSLVYPILMYSMIFYSIPVRSILFSMYGAISLVLSENRWLRDDA